MFMCHLFLFCVVNLCFYGAYFKLRIFCRIMILGCIIHAVFDCCTFT